MSSDKVGLDQYEFSFGKIIRADAFSCLATQKLWKTVPKCPDFYLSAVYQLPAAKTISR